MVFDGHSDIFSDVRYRREAGETEVLQRRHLPRLRRGGIEGACCVIWADTGCGLSPAAEMDAILRAAEADLAECAEVTLIHTAAEAEAARQAGQFYILAGLEGLAGIGADLEQIERFYDFGCRHAMLTWNEQNALATGVRGDPARGLTPLGRRAVRRIQERRMLLDVSHLNERSFWDLLSLAEAPVLASHSNAKALAGAARNLTDAQLRAIRDTDGLVGLNAYGPFLSDDPTARHADQLVRQACYIADEIGTEHLAFGFDFLEFLPPEHGGVPYPALAGLADCGEVPSLLEKMRAAGFTAAELEAISRGNWLRLMRRVLG